MKCFIFFLGRLCLSLIFLASGVHKILDWETESQLFATALNDWVTYSVGSDWLHELLEMAVPFASILLAGAVICELLGGLCVLLNVQIRFGTILLIIFLIPATILLHPFWYFQGTDQGIEVELFLRNVGILGGLLILLAYGKGGRCPVQPASGAHP